MSFLMNAMNALPSPEAPVCPSSVPIRCVGGDAPVMAAPVDDQYRHRQPTCRRRLSRFALATVA